MKIKKLLALFIAAILVVCSLPLSVSAAAGVNDIDGIRTVFLGTFGKVSYNGKSYESFKTFNDALNALGADGGRIVLSGNVLVSEFNDISGRKPITIVGVGSNSSGNLVDFSGQSEIKLAGDLSMGNVNIKNDADAYILTNGFKFETFDNFDTYHQEKYVADGPNIISYPNPPSVALGTSDKGGMFSLTEGKYAVVSAGAISNHNVTGNTNVILSGGEIETAVSGNYGNGILKGDSKLTLDGGVVKKLIAGSDGGTVNGNVFTEINSGSVEEFVIGSTEGSSVEGSLIVSINGGEIGKITTASGKISGKKIIIINPELKIDLGSSNSDYTVSISGGFCEPKFDANNIKGFFITDKYGIPAKEIIVNGEKTANENSIYQLNPGKNEITVENRITLEINKHANYVNGYEDGTFRPQNNMTKAEAVTLLARLLVDDSYIKGHVTSDYEDVSEGSWYESYIGFFEKLGFLDLISEDYGLKFSPDRNITRGEFTQLIYEVSSYATNSASSKLRSFSDVSSNNPYAGAINYAVSQNIITGYEDNTFKPDNSITRAEVVTMVNRMLGRIPNGQPGDNSFNDISEHWANSQILAACNPENVSWTNKGEDSKYVLTGTTAKDYVIGLYEQSATLSADAIREGVDVISEQMKKNILNSADTYDLSKKDKVIYISEKNGNDENDGLSPEKPLKTIAGLTKIKFLRNAAVLFERGGIYRGQIVCSPNTYYGAYGEGPKPLLMQSRRNYADESLWVETEYPNVYKCTELLNNVGVIGFDHDLFDYSDASYDEKYGWIMNKNIAGFTGVKDMDEDLQFFSDIQDNDLNKLCTLYLYSTEGNPGKRFKSIEIGEKYDIVDGTPTNVTIENLAFKFTGAHAIGIGGATKFAVKNCVFSWLGGSLLSLDFFNSGRPVNYGNAIETSTCNGYYLDDNWMYQIYDTGVTHQCSRGTGTRIQRDVRYTGNLIEYVHWGIEFYNSPEGALTNDVRLTDGVYDAYNVCRFGGYGWGSIVRYRQTGAQLYCGSSLGENKNQLTEYNIFDRCAGNLLCLPSNSTEVDDKNIYIQTIGNRLGNLKGKQITCSYDAADDIAKFWKDKNAVVIVIDPEKEPIEQYNK